MRSSPRLEALTIERTRPKIACGRNTPARCRAAFKTVDSKRGPRNMKHAALAGLAIVVGYLEFRSDLDYLIVRGLLVTRNHQERRRGAAGLLMAGDTELVPALSRLRPDSPKTVRSTPAAGLPSVIWDGSRLEDRHTLRVAPTAGYRHHCR